MKTTDNVKKTVIHLADLLNVYIIPFTNEVKNGNFSEVQRLSDEAMEAIPSRVDDEDFRKVNECLNFLYNVIYCISRLSLDVVDIEKAPPTLFLAMNDSLSSLCDAAYNVVFETAVTLNDINKSRCAENKDLIDDILK